MTLKEFLNLTPDEQFAEAKKCFPDIEVLDWNLAKRLQGECEEFSKYIEKIEEILFPDDYYMIGFTSHWIVYDTSPKTLTAIIAACMLAKDYFK